MRWYKASATPTLTAPISAAWDIWHTCEPDKVVTEGWVGKALRELDPNGEDELTGINFGIGLPRAMAVPGVPVTSVNDLDSYGLLTGIGEDDQRDQALQIFKDMYAQAIGTGPVMEYLSRTGMDVLRGADRLKAAPAQYSSSVEYGDNAIAKSLRDIARVHTTGLGTRIFYTSHGGYDTHANENPTHPKLLQDLSGAVRDFFDDLNEHDAADNVVMLVFTEFGRRIKDNGSGTDHAPEAARLSSASRSMAASTPSTRPSVPKHGRRARTWSTRLTSAASTPPCLNNGWA